uniref:Protein strawberry notch homolog 1-like n=1 Tax=Bursaphelenchus xylophilus TaxID=6326 RepID=A0A1I7S5S4_BURXY
MDDILQTALLDAGLDFFDTEPEETKDGEQKPDEVTPTEEVKKDAAAEVIEPTVESEPVRELETAKKVDEKDEKPDEIAEPSPQVVQQTPAPIPVAPVVPVVPTTSKVEAPVPSTSSALTTGTALPPVVTKRIVRCVGRPISTGQVQKALEPNSPIRRYPTHFVSSDGKITHRPGPVRTFRQIRTIAPNGTQVIQRIPMNEPFIRKPEPLQQRTAKTVLLSNDGTRTIRTYNYSAGGRISEAPVIQTPQRQGPSRAPQIPTATIRPRLGKNRILNRIWPADPPRPRAPPRPFPKPLMDRRLDLPDGTVQFIKPIDHPRISTPGKPGVPKYTTEADEKKPDKPESSLNSMGYEDDEEKHVQVDTFIEYKPLKLRSGCEHPDSVVETASLSAVSAPDITYQMKIPEETIDSGKISALQLEAALYACQAQERWLPSGERVGYLIGDGAGVGKGRTIATIIYENYLMGRKRALWFSVSSDLYYDAVRDLRDIGADNVDVYQLNQMKYARINSVENGNIKKGVIFATYSSLICEARHLKDDESKGNKITSRLQQLIQWCGADFDGPIIFDECHHAKNLVPSAGSKPTKTGRYVLELQKSLPDARVIYASATGATEPRNMAYMTRLGLWGEKQCFPTFSDFIHAVEDRGVGAMEMVAMDMKLRGLYLARQLSFKGVSFAVEEVQLDDDFVKLYDESVKLWMECRRQFQFAIDALKSDERNEKTVWAQFWSAHQRFFKYLCIGAKVNACVAITKKALEDGKCVVIGLQSTGEAQTLGVLGDAGEITDFVSTTKAVLQNLIEKHFPTGDSDGMGMLGDMGRMFSIGSGGSFSRKRNRTTVYDNIQPSFKRRRENSLGTVNESERSSNTEDEEEEEEEDESDSDAEKSDDDSDDSILDEEDDDDEEDSEEDSEEEEEINGPDNNTTDRKKNDSLFDTLMNELNDSYVPDVDPFHHDFSSAEDPWAHLQNYQEDQRELEEQKRREAMEEAKRKKEELKRKKKIKRRKKLRRLRKEREERKRKEKELAEQRRVENATSAVDFIQSTKVIDNGNQRDPSSLLMIKTELLAAVERLGQVLPPNTLDQLIDELGGPDVVAEMTGRKGRIVVQPNGSVEYQPRNANSMAPVDLMNLEEKEKFMNGEKFVAVISEAASSGISLQSDRRVKNKRRRVHITLELPWSADKAVQQFGRTHRSNQLSAPEYLFLISELAGEKRFASVVAKRLESLGALTHGDRRATESRDLSQFNLDNRYGREALQIMIRTLANPRIPPLLPPPKDYRIQNANFFEDMREYLVGVGVLSKNPNNPAGVLTIEKEGVSLAKFLNRLLGLPVHAQNALFGYFTDIINELIKRAKANGTFDKGIMDLGHGTDTAREMEKREFRGVIDNSNFLVKMHKIGAERGVKWEDAVKLLNAQVDDTDDVCGFYVGKPNLNKKVLIILVVHSVKRSALSMSNQKMYTLIRPNSGRSSKSFYAQDITRRHTRIPMVEAEKIWKEHYDMLGTMCFHKYLIGFCRTEEQSVFCEVGRRFRTYFVLSGSVIAVWPILEKALNEAKPNKNTAGPNMQTVRIQTEGNQKLVGLLVKPQHVKTLLKALNELEA